MKNTALKRIAAILSASLIMSSVYAVPVSAQWHKTDSGYYYTDSDGKKLTGLNKINGSVYYFDKNGKMYTGWLKTKKGYCYFGSDGKRVSGWKKIKGKTYYFKSNGIMVTGTVTIKGKKYTFSDVGVLQSKGSSTSQSSDIKPGDIKSILNSVELEPDYFLADGKDEYGLNSELFSRYWDSDFSEKDADKLLKKKLSSITKNKETNYEKVKAVYDWIIKNTSYEHGGFGNYLSVDCVINDKIGVCSDYSFVFMAMMRYLGFDAKMISGQTHKSGGGYTGHEWVEININGTAYVFDPQVEDNIAGRNNGKIQYQRFCKTYSEVKDKYKK